MRYFLIIFLSALYLNTYAQSSDNSWKRPSWWNKDIEKVNQDTITVTEKPNIDSETNDLLSFALSPSLVIIRQQYQLERNGEHFGKNNRPYYGETFSLGVKTSGGMLFMDQVMEPWKFDKDYDKVNSTDKYKPVLFQSYQKIISDSIYRPVDFELKSKYVRAINKEKDLYYHEEPRCDFGLNIDYTGGNKEGYMIWAYSDRSVNDSTMSVTLKCSPYTTEIGQDLLREFSPVNADKIIGGLFVVPSVETGGRVIFHLVGMTVKYEDNKWHLQLLTKNLDKSIEKKDKKETKSNSPTKE